MKRIAVIGSSGQLGTDLVEVLESGRSCELFPLTHRDVECTDPRSVREALELVRPHVVINCAAVVRVDDCEERPEEAFAVNASGARHVAQTCAELDALCLYVSTDYVFDGEKGKPYTEEDAPNPLNVYGVSKLAGEYFVRNLSPKHLIVRTSGLYGVAGCSGKGSNFVETMVRLCKEGQSIRVVDDQVLAPTYTKDLAHKICELLQTDACGLYHITNTGQCSWFEFAGAIFRLVRSQSDFGPTTTAAFGSRARRPAYSVLAPEKLLQLGLEVLRPWPEALGAYLRERGYASA